MRDRIDDEITFRKLEVLLAFMETGNLSKAAETLNVSTVSVHRALHSLEQGVRCALFRHEGRNLKSTEAAQMLAEVAREVLTLMADGICATREAAGYSSDRLKIGSLYSLTIRTVPGIVVDIKVRRPALQVELVLGSNVELLDKLKQGAIDAALMPCRMPSPKSNPFRFSKTISSSRHLQIRRTRIRTRLICGTAATRHSYHWARGSSRIAAFWRRFASRTLRLTSR